jgi:hypothetical protein
MINVLKVLFPTLSTFIAAKDSDEEDEEKEEYKILKRNDDPAIIAERKFNFVVIKVPIIARKTHEVKVLHCSLIPQVAVLS